MEMEDVYDIPNSSKNDLNSSYDIMTFENMKRDLKKIKKLLLSLGLFMAILLAVSLIVAIIATLAYSKPAGSPVSDNNIRNITSSELLRVLNETASNQEEKFSLLQEMFMKNLSSQLEELYLLQTNLSSIKQQVGAMKDRLDGLDLLLNTDLDSVREELVSLSNLSEITSTRRDIDNLRREIRELRNSFNGNTSSLMVGLSALDSHLTTNFTMLTNQISSLHLSTYRNITSAVADIEILRRDVSNLQTSTTNSISSITSQLRFQPFNNKQPIPLIPLPAKLTLYAPHKIEITHHSQTGSQASNSKQQLLSTDLQVKSTLYVPHTPVITRYLQIVLQAFKARQTASVAPFQQSIPACPDQLTSTRAVMKALSHAQ